MKYIIVSIVTNKALYGIGGKTLLFSSYENAYEIGLQFFAAEADFRVVEIKI